MNRNVVLCLVRGSFSWSHPLRVLTSGAQAISALSGLADSIWSGTVFAGYLYVITNSSNTNVVGAERVSSFSGSVS